ncbi:LuxR C-terminal-related transcriptional regulator [Hydrogenophaga palleronii]|uniref:helix-turn-helix transcriptional regulator n=1 Tax=Hydrogenophaga palleronii TaxID=65655 RepID=UPI00286B716B|nr:LuxR C-terminal-related transcriptional regulator [Hydrogenophaga palleronii]
MATSDVLDDFKRALFALIHRLMPVDGIRFFIYVPWAQLQQDSASHAHLDTMLRQYAETYWALDPMHPSRFEDQDTVVVSNSMLMSDADWRQSEIFTGFYQPNGHFHNCDVFLKQQGRIVAVLSLVRRDPVQPFTEAEVDRLNQAQPFVEYSLGAIHVSSRVISRASLSELFHLTPREMDVVEIAVTGVSNKALCRHLGISLPTLRSHVQSIYAKVGVRSSSELIARLAPIQFN